MSTHYRIASRLLTAVLVTSLIFAAAHYAPFNPSAEAMQLRWNTFDHFTFHFLAGAFLASLYVKRGFGIAAGSHALYNIFTILTRLS